MDSNISNNLPEWLTPERIKHYRDYLKKAIPYTDQEVLDRPFDSMDYDIDRDNAYTAKRLLTYYGIPLTDDEDTTE